MEKFAYSVDEVIEVTTIGRSKLYELMASGELESVQVGRRRLIPAEALRRFMDRLVEVRAGRLAQPGTLAHASGGQPPPATPTPPPPQPPH
jgi:excisionase family DNA binding protein